MVIVVDFARVLILDGLTVSFKEWAMQEQRAWSGAGLLLWFSYNA